jgi:hypothetical protein
MVRAETLLRRFRQVSGLVGLAACGCTDQSWADNLHGAIDRPGVYAPVIAGLTPDQDGLRALWRSTPRDGLCSVLNQEPGAPFWLFDLELSHWAPGEFPVGKNVNRDDVGRTSRIRVSNIDRSGRRTFSALARSGMVDVTSLASDYGAWRVGQPFKARIAAWFPEEPYSEVICRASGATSAPSSIQRECTCRRGDGSEVTCVPMGTDGECCSDIGDAKVFVEAALEANPCLEACIATDASLFGRCRELANGSY